MSKCRGTGEHDGEAAADEDALRRAMVNEDDDVVPDVACGAVQCQKPVFRHVYRHGYRHVFRHVYRHVYRLVCRHRYRHVYRHGYRQVYRHRAVQSHKRAFSQIIIITTLTIMIE